MPDWLPRSEQNLLSWLRNFRTNVVADYARFNIPPAIAAEFSAMVDDFAEKYRLANTPATRTVVTTTDKNDSMRRVKQLARQLAASVRIATENDPAARVLTGLNPRKQRVRKRPRPTSAPAVYVRSVIGTKVTLLVLNAEFVGRRARPKDAEFGAIYTAVGPQPPANPREWKFRRMTSRRKVEIDFGPDIPAGTRVWFVARWMSNQQEAGPLSVPISIHLASLGEGAA